MGLKQRFGMRELSWINWLDSVRLLSLIQGRKVKSVEGRDSKVDVLIGKKIPHKKSRQPLEPRIYGNRCIPQEGHNDAKILLGTLTSGALCHVTVVMAQDRAELLCASPRYHGHM